MKVLPLWSFLISLSFSVRAEEHLELFQFKKPETVQALEANHAQIEVVADAKFPGLQITFQPSEWPNVYLRSGKAFQQRDWRGFGDLALEVANPEDEALALYVRVDDDFSADGTRHCRTGSFTVPAHGQGVMVLPVGASGVEGMRGQPARPGDWMMVTNGATLDGSHIVAFQVFLAQPAKPRRLILQNVRLRPPARAEGLVDRFGQYTGADWKGKVREEGDLEKQRRAEKKGLTALLVSSDRDAFGGWISGPRLKSNWYFRTAYVVGGKEVAVPTEAGKDGGRWWLVTPEGTLFFSLGMDCVWGGERTPTAGRERLFSWLPLQGDPLEEFAPVDERRWVDFHAINQHRKYGPTWRKQWPEVALRRLRSWGFNTIGNWSSPEVFRLRHMPYTVPIHYATTATIQTSWSGMPDVFSEKFSAETEAAVERETREWKDYPWCLGYFVDNELPWSGWGDSEAAHDELPRAVLACGGKQPAKREFVRLLRAKYDTVARLSEAWGGTWTSFDDLEQQPQKLSDKPTAACRGDLAAFLEAFARRYFAVVHAALRKHAPRQLYLGCRFAVRPPEVVRVAAEFCDVVTFNIYQKTLKAEEWAFTANLGKPCLVGEFHFGALDRGMFHGGLVPVANQEERGQAYQQYVESVLQLPAFAGCHWFQYRDEPLTGRFDGENYNIGFVDVTDQFYPELAAAAKVTNTRVYSALAGQERP